MALILNIESCTVVCSVALGKNGELLDVEESADVLAHSERMTVFIEKILSRNNLSVSDLDAIAVSMGPGSYTGLRIGVSVAKGLCYGANKPLIGINTLQSIAAGLVASGKLTNISLKGNALLCPMIDARRMEVYTGFFDMDMNIFRETKADIINESSYADLLTDRQIVFFGNGSAKCSDSIKGENAIYIDDITTSATGMCQLAEQSFLDKKFEDVAYFEPFYLKDFVAIAPRNKVIGE